MIGSKEFVESCFEAKREFFGPKRKRGGDWGDLRSVRDLRANLPDVCPCDR